jgi:hypothetical protein
MNTPWTEIFGSKKRICSGKRRRMIAETLIVTYLKIFILGNLANKE